MSMFDGDQGWNGFGGEPQPFPQPEPAPEPAPDVPAAPGAGNASVPSGAGSASGSPAESRPRPKRAKTAFAWTVDRVRQAREALALLDDERARNVVAAATDVDADDVDRLALTVLKGSLAQPAGLLVAWHDESDAMRRAIDVGRTLDKDAALVRRAARIMLALDPTLAGSVKPTGSSPTDLQYALASAAPGLDVDAVRGLA